MGLAKPTGGPDDRIPNQRFHLNARRSDLYQRSWHHTGPPGLNLGTKCISRCPNAFTLVKRLGYGVLILQDLKMESRMQP